MINSYKSYAFKFILFIIVSVTLSQFYFQIYGDNFNLFELFMLSTTNKLIILIFYSIMPIFSIVFIDEIREININELLNSRTIASWFRKKTLKILLFIVIYMVLLNILLIAVGLLNDYNIDNKWTSFFTYSNSFFSIDSLIHYQQPFQYIGAFFSPIAYYLLSIILIIARGLFLSLITYAVFILFRKINIALSFTTLLIIADIYFVDIFPQLSSSILPSFNTSVVYSNGGLSWILLVLYWIALLIISYYFAITATVNYVGFLIGSDEN